MSRGSSVSHSSIGRAASTVISSLPLGRRRTRPGAAGPSGITSCSRWMPRASVTVKIASISFIVTTSSIDTDLGRARRDLPPRLVVDRDPTGAPIARGALLGLARGQDFLGTAGQRRPAPETEKRGDPRGKVAWRQEAPGVDAHHPGALPSPAFGPARRAGATPERDGRQALRARLRDRQGDAVARHDLAESLVAVEARDRRGLQLGLDGRRRIDFSGLEGVDVVRDADHAV